MNQETKTCRQCSEKYEITPDDFSFYEKMGVPAPGLCPECRFKRRALFRNETTLYTRKCDMCSKSLVSMYNPKSPYTIYCEQCWDSDNWDPHEFQMDYDESKSFFEQFGELMKKVPKKATLISSSTKLGPNVNSDYTNVAGGNKDCYLLFSSGGCENVMYSRGLNAVRDSLDIYFGIKLEHCYEGVNVHESSGVNYGQHVVGTLDSSFMLNTSGCQHCFGCVNLRNKTHNFFNEQLSKEEYERRISEIRGSYSKTEEMRKKFDEFSLTFPRRATSNLKSVNCTGDYVFESKNILDSFENTNCEDSRYLFATKFTKDSYDVIGFGYEAELLLEAVTTGYTSRAIGTYWAENCQDIEYSFSVRKSQYCIGCDGINGKKYCILNKQYTKEEYNVLREKIVNELKRDGEYGLYLPPSTAPFGYNETIGQDNMPLTKDEAITQGFRWEDDMQMTTGKETMKPEGVPDNINDVTDFILEEVLSCISCKRNYRITPAELQFYRKIILPIPRKCFYCRHKDRIKRRGPMKIFDRTCDNCEKQIKTTYAPDRPEIVYCEECYQKEVI